MVQPCGMGRWGEDRVGNKVATFAVKISETGGMRANPNMRSTFSRLRRIPESRGPLEGGGGGFPEPGVRIKGIDAHWLHDREEASRHHARSGKFTRSLRFSRRKKRRGGQRGHQIYIYMEEQSLPMVGEGPYRSAGRWGKWFSCG